MGLLDSIKAFFGGKPAQDENAEAPQEEMTTEEAPREEVSQEEAPKEEERTEGEV